MATVAAIVKVELVAGRHGGGVVILVGVLRVPWRPNCPVDRGHRRAGGRRRSLGFGLRAIRRGRLCVAERCGQHCQTENQSFLKHQHPRFPANTFFLGPRMARRFTQ